MASVSVLVSYRAKFYLVACSYLEILLCGGACISRSHCISIREGVSRKGAGAGGLKHFWQKIIEMHLTFVMNLRRLLNACEQNSVS